MHVDQPAGAPRYSYALVEDGDVTAVALLALNEPIEGVPTFQLGYAVMESRRGGGRAQRVEGGDQRDMSRASQERDSEAVFRGGGRRENIVSLHIAEKVIGGTRTECLDHDSAVPAIQFQFLVGSSA
ncbi:MAG: hypothetical protein BVN33_13860 [Proteobacteria bacterium ST_bin13]|nr:MAG: hypothetical protein BVN33_13860 [Proteobacteria bacterium ST_bin13]